MKRYSNSNAQALRELAANMRARLDEIDAMIVSNEGGESLDAWSTKWFAERAKRGHDADHERLNYLRWIAPQVGSRPVAGINRHDIDAWLEHIEGAVLDGRLRATTAWRIWTVLRSMLRDAGPGGRVRSLRVRIDNPTLGFRPNRGTCRASTFLYPSEFLRLVSCSKVPLALRRQYALAVYLYPRAGELAALEWSDVDLATRRVHIHQTLKRNGQRGPTKTGEDRQFVAERTLLPLLRVMHRQAKGKGLLADLGDRTGKGKELRAALLRAGCTRDDLHADDAARRPITFHDLRATGITWMAMRGDSPTDMMERVGHLHLATTERYMRRGRLMVTGRSERVFPPLPRCLFGRRA